MNTHRWSRREILPTLSVEGNGDLIVFKAGDEIAEVQIKDLAIDNVLYSLGDQKTKISTDQSKRIVVGSGNNKRYVDHYLYPSGPARFMRLGLTTHSGPGTWSSLPHGFELNPEEGFEEVFFYMNSGGTGKAIQVGEGVWADGSRISDCWRVDNFSFSTIPMGYHPVSAEPEVTVRYIWAYLCKHPRWEKVDF